MPVNRDFAPIEEGASYPKPEFCRRVGWGEYSFRQAKQSGLKTVRIGGRVYVLGEDFNDFLRAQQQCSATAVTPGEMSIPAGSSFGGGG